MVFTSKPQQDRATSHNHTVSIMLIERNGDAWNKCRSMSKEAAMSAYIDEIRQILETMPQTNEVLEFTQLIGPFYEFVDDRAEQNGPLVATKKKPARTNIHKKKSDLSEPYVNGVSEGECHLADHHKQPVSLTNGPTQTPVSVSAGNGRPPSSSPSSSSSSMMSSSDVDEVYDDPSDPFPFTHGLSNDETTPSNPQNDEPVLKSDIPHEQSSNRTARLHPHAYGGQDGNNVPVHHSSREGHHSNGLHRSSVQSSSRNHTAMDGARYSPSSVASGGGDGRHPNNNHNIETQRAILTALTKLQRDVNNILERLNRLETSAHFLQQRELTTQLYSSSQSKSLSRWLPLAGLRRRAIAFILLWPFFVFALIRLFLRARIIIRFRQPRR